MNENTKFECEFDAYDNVMFSSDENVKHFPENEILTREIIESQEDIEVEQKYTPKYLFNGSQTLQDDCTFLKINDNKLIKSKFDVEAKNIIYSPSAENVLFPSSEYFEAQVAKSQLTDFCTWLKRTMEFELECAKRGSILTEVNVETNLERLFKTKTDIKINRAISPDIFEECSNYDVKPIFDSKQYFCNKIETVDFGSSAVENNCQRKQFIIEQIEEFVKLLLQDIGKEKPFEIRMQNSKNWNNISFINEILTLKPNALSIERKVSFSNKNSKLKFATILSVLAEIYHLLVTDSTCTTRELYYNDPELLQSQANIASAVNDICILLNATSSELGILASSKGLIAGPIKITFQNNDILDCAPFCGGVFIPSEATNVKRIESTAKLVLVVEKHAIYDKLLQENILTSFGYDILLVTGKGYPDINTRIILKKITEQLKVPLYIIVDADPFGIEILSVYRYGSRAMSFNSDNLACPHIQWIGVHPSEMELLTIPSVPLKEEDTKKLAGLLQRSYLDEDIREELITLQRINRKSEIEGIINFSYNFLTTDYIPNKLKRKLIL